MGYTHYWYNQDGFTPAQWEQFTSIISGYISRSGMLANGLGQPDTSPYIDPEVVSFNGIEPHAFETCHIVQAGERFSFCKTGARPYDALVVAVLVTANRCNPAFMVHSDGRLAELADGIQIAGDWINESNPGGLPPVLPPFNAAEIRP
jgi:hypothetical protein